MAGLCHVCLSNSELRTFFKDIDWLTTGQSYWGVTTLSITILTIMCLIATLSWNNFQHWMLLCIVLYWTSTLLTYSQQRAPLKRLSQCFNKHYTFSNTACQLAFSHEGQTDTQLALHLVVSRKKDQSRVAPDFDAYLSFNFLGHKLLLCQIWWWLFEFFIWFCFIWPAKYNPTEL